MPLNIKDLKVTSPAFGQGDRIPDVHTTNGDNVSPPLEFSGIPEGTKQLALVCHDPDAPLPHGFTHWVVYGIPASTTGIPAGGGTEFMHGETSYGENAYGGPQPPPGHGTHHYFFWLYALDTEIDAEPGLTSAELIAKIEDHVIEQARLVGTYDN